MMMTHAMTTHAPTPCARERRAMTTTRRAKTMAMAMTSARAAGEPTSLASPARAHGAISRAVSVAASVLVAFAMPHAALAIPQTSECATNSCDGYDYSGKDFSKTGEYFTKGSLKRANFNDTNLTGVTLFGADLSNATFVNANLTNANLGQCNLTGADFTNAVLSGAIVSSANLEDAIITNSDWTDVIVRKDVQTALCKVADGSNPVTGEITALSLLCP